MGFDVGIVVDWSDCRGRGSDVSLDVFHEVLLNDSVVTSIRTGTKQTDTCIATPCPDNRKCVISQVCICMDVKSCAFHVVKGFMLEVVVVV